ncbi:MAG: hypothetical protein WAT23_02335 [Chromatiaceae bacterium]
MNKQSIQQIKSLFDPGIAEFVNWQRVVTSTKFALLAGDLIEHFHQHGDKTLIKRILDNFRNQKYFKPLLLWFCDSAGLDFSFQGAELVLKRTSNLKTLEGDLATYLTKYNGTAKVMGGLIVKSENCQLTRKQKLAQIFNPDGHRGGKPVVQGGAPGLGRH